VRSVPNTSIAVASSKGAVPETTATATLGMARI
jgi:septum formation inhibitor-activating ATPase MinD